MKKLYDEIREPHGLLTQRGVLDDKTPENSHRILEAVLNEMEPHGSPLDRYDGIPFPWPAEAQAVEKAMTQKAATPK